MPLKRAYYYNTHFFSSRTNSLKYFLSHSAIRSDFVFVNIFLQLFPKNFFTILLQIFCQFYCKIFFLLQINFLTMYIFFASSYFIASINNKFYYFSNCKYAYLVIYHLSLFIYLQVENYDFFLVSKPHVLISGSSNMFIFLFVSENFFY